MRRLINERRVGRILKKPREAWDVIQGDLDGRAMVEVRLVHESAGRWIETSTVEPFRCRAEAALEIGRALCAVTSEGGARG